MPWRTPSLRQSDQINNAIIIGIDSDQGEVLAIGDGSVAELSGAFVGEDMEMAFRIKESRIRSAVVVEIGPDKGAGRLSLRETA